MVDERVLRRLQLAADEAVTEAVAARTKYPPFHSMHEAWAVLYEEVDELWDEVRKRRDKRSKNAVREESLQIAAVALRIATECGE